MTEVKISTISLAVNRLTNSETILNI